MPESFTDSIRFNPRNPRQEILLPLQQLSHDVSRARRATVPRSRSNAGSSEWKEESLQASVHELIRDAALQDGCEPM